MSVCQAWGDRNFLVKSIKLKARKLDERTSEMDMDWAQRVGIKRGGKNYILNVF